MPDLAELEIQLRARDLQNCTIGFRFRAPGDDATRIDDSLGVFRIPKLRAHEADESPSDYGSKLSYALFHDQAVIDKFRSYRDKSPTGLRVRLLLPSELQGIRWETLVDPDPNRHGAPLFAGGSVFLSRYLTSTSWNPARSRRRSELSALVVVANPEGEFLLTEDGKQEERRLSPVDVAGELSRAVEALQKAKVNPITLASDPDSPAPVACVSSIAAALRAGIDILYLVCHGALIDGEPQLWLEAEDPAQPYLPVAASTLIRAIRDLPRIPRLIVLASCQSAGAGASQDSGVLAALGPRLIAEAGAGAVVAMQGNVLMKTVEIFMPKFFEFLLADGQMDQALTLARGVAYDMGCPDYWAPALYTRLQNGAVWYEPGFAGESERFDWSILCRSIKKEQCVPIIGPDLAEHIYGTTASIAHELAMNESYPMSGQDSGDLAKVTQFMGTKAQGSKGATLAKVQELLTDRFYRNAPAIVAPDVEPDLETVAKALAASETDPLRIAASLEASVYVTASSDSLFEAVLAATPLASGKQRDVTSLVINWRDERRLVSADVGGNKAVYCRSQTEQFGGDPSREKPLLYSIFGKRSEDEEMSWVLTEDDVFDYLIQTSKYDLLPNVVTDALGSRSILFLGFPLDDWKFRVLFRMILAIEGNSQLGLLSHVGVQVDPDHSSLADLAGAKRYIEEYYKHPGVMRPGLPAPKISIYWGTSADFLRQLSQELKTTVLRKSV